MPFGGLLGSTFNFVFETQLEALQNGDRFYYLARTAGLNFLNELENNSFAKMIMANTDATHLPGRRVLDAGLHPRGRPDEAVHRPTKQVRTDQGNADMRRTASTAIPIRWRHCADAAGHPRTTRRRQAPTRTICSTPAKTMSCSAAPTGDDIIIASIGDDTLWGDGGNDRLEGGDGSRQHRGRRRRRHHHRQRAATTSSRATTATTSSTAATASTSSSAAPAGADQQRCGGRGR